MLECKDFDEKLLDYLYEELPPVARQACEQHLAGCARCQGELGSFGGVRRAARQLELVEPPAAVSAKLMYQAAQLAPRRRGKVLPLVRKLWQHPAYAMAACFLIVGGVTSWQLIVRGEVPMAAPAVREKEASPPAEGAGTAVAPPVKTPVPAASVAELEEQKAAPEPVVFDKRASRKVAPLPSKGLASLPSAKPKAAFAQEGYQPAPKAADGDEQLDSLDSVSAKADKARGLAEEPSLKKERPTTVVGGKASPRGGAFDDALALPEIQRPAEPQQAAPGAVSAAPPPKAVQLPLGKEQNQQLARDTLPQSPETRTRAAKPLSAVGPADRELEGSNEKNSPTSATVAPAREEASAGAGAPSAGGRLDSNFAQGPTAANRVAGNLGEDSACREVELRLRTEGQARVSPDDLWTDYLCLKRRGQAASTRAQGDLRRLVGEFPSFRSDEVLAERRENEGLDERNQRQLEGWDQQRRVRKGKQSAPAKASESNKAY
jgi:hypothetical protein